MKFKITKHREVKTTNIFGKPADINEYYTIDRVVLWLFHLSLEFRRSDNGIGMIPISDVRMMVRYKPSRFATQFSFKEDAEAVLNDIYSNPNKYIRSI